MAFYHGHDHMPFDKVRGQLLLDASTGAGCRLDALSDKMEEDDLSEEEKQKILKDLKEIAKTSPYHWVDIYIGRWYEKGWGGEENKKHAVVWYLKAIKGGDAQAMYNLAAAYAKGDLGLTQSDTKAIELLTLAAEKGNAYARYNLGHHYNDGEGVEIDFNRCAELWEQSAKQGYVSAQFNLCDLYKDGSLDNENGNPMTIPLNHPLHFKWALAAAQQGDKDGQVYTADCYANGWGVERNLVSAFEWYMKAAEQDDSIAQYCVGRYFEEGRGTDIDLIQALSWYRKAAAQGYQVAMEAVERLS